MLVNPISLIDFLVTMPSSWQLTNVFNTCICTLQREISKYYIETRRVYSTGLHGKLSLVPVPTVTGPPAPIIGVQHLLIL